MKKIDYDRNIFDFRNKVSQYLDIENLEKIHDIVKFEGILTDVEGGNSDQGQDLHKKFYAGMDSDPTFKEVYDEFIAEVVKPHFDGPIIFQKFPTFRIHQPNNICVFDWHKDKEFNHYPTEVNIFLPMTNAFDTNTIWAESEEDKKDFAPLEANYGQIFLWNGANLNHGSKINETDSSRVSFDFRVMLLEDYEKQELTSSLTKGKPLKRGEYFDERIIS